MRRLLIMGLLLAPLSVSAQEPPDSLRRDTIPPVPSFLMRALTINVPRALATAGGASAVEINLDSISPGPAPTLEDVLRAMPLVHIRSNSRGEAQPALRGAEDRQVAILVDGVPLTLGWDARTDLSVIPLTAARRIRLVRGLSTVLHGPNVLGGAIEIDVARGPERFAPPDPLSLQVGFDHTGSTSMAATAGMLTETGGGELELRGGAGFQDRRDLPLPAGLGADDGQRLEFLGKDGRRLNSDVRRLDGFGSVRYKSDAGRWFSASGSGYRVERGVPPEAHVDDPRLWRYPYQSRVLVALSGGTGFQDTLLGSGDLEASLGIDLGRTEIDAFRTAAFDDVVKTQEADDRTLTFRMSGDLGVGGRTDVRAAVTVADVFHREVLDSDPASEFEQRLWSVGAEVERRVGGMPAVPGLGVTRLTGGFAIDGSDTPRSGGKTPRGGLWDWGARLGVSSLSSGGGVLYHASLSRRTRFPALRELYSGALGRFEPNPDLDPEVLLATEFGFTVSRERGEVQVVGFHQRLTDGIIRSTVQTDEGPKFRRINQAQVRSTGLEVMASAALGSAALTGDLTLQYVRGIEPDGSSIELEYEPSVVGRIGVQSPLPGELLGSAGVTFVGGQLCQNPEIGGLEAFDARPRVDLGVRRRFELRGGGPLKRLEARVAIDNLSDAAVFDQCGLPQPGRTLSVEMRLW